eukprot:gb/GECG01005670.1/.p1 GENE.gb/GECG01005670.1/~~gb/GECG01005670.1/.p1  ORF type:complete len:743 (+),score=34.17 gb/GECG01005670.1/:1-2229(+)
MVNGLSPSQKRHRRHNTQRCICYFCMTVLMGTITYSSFALNAQIMKYYRYVFVQGTIVLNALGLISIVLLRHVPWSRLQEGYRGVCSNIVRRRPTGLERIGKSRHHVASRMFSPSAKSLNQNRRPLLDDSGSIEEQQLKPPMVGKESSRRWFELGTKRGGFVLRADIQFLIALSSCISSFLLHIGATQLAPSVVVMLLPVYSASGFIAEVCYRRLRNSVTERRRMSSPAPDYIDIDEQQMSDNAASVFRIVKASFARHVEDYGWSGFGTLLILFSVTMAFIPGVIDSNGTSDNQFMWPHDFDMSAAIGVWFIVSASVLHGCTQIFRRTQVYKHMRLLSLKDNSALDPKNRPKHYPDALRDEMGITLIKMLIGFLLMTLAGLMQDTSSKWCTKKIKNPVKEGVMCAIGFSKNGDGSCFATPILFLSQFFSGIALSALYLTLQHREIVYDTLFEHFSLKSAWRARVAEITTKVSENLSSSKHHKVSKSEKGRTYSCRVRCRPGALISIGIPLSLMLAFWICYALEVSYDRFAASPGSSYDSSADRLGVYFVPFAAISCTGLLLMHRKTSPSQGNALEPHATLFDQLFFTVSNHERRDNFVGSVSGSWFRLAHFTNLKWLHGMQIGVNNLWELLGRVHPSSLNGTETTVPTWKSSMGRKIFNGIAPILRAHGEDKDLCTPEEIPAETSESTQQRTANHAGMEYQRANNNVAGTPIPSLQDLPGINMTQLNSTRGDQNAPFGFQRW